MRWLILFLVLVNIAFFSWQQFFLNNKSSMQSTLAKYTQQSEDVEPFQLLSEVPDAKKKSLLVSSPNGELITSPQPQCWIAGPFPNLAMGNRLLDELALKQVSGDLKNVTFPGQTMHLVYLQQEGGETQARKLLKTLHNQGRESFLITDGPLKNAISVGVFSSKDKAIVMLNEYKSAGYDSKMTEKARMVSEIWAAFTEDDYKKISESRWVSLLSGYKNVEKQQNFCDVIASYPNID